MTDSNQQVSSEERPLARRVFTLQVRIVGKLNDVHIFAQQAIPLLKVGRKKFEASTHKKNRRYYVPAVGRTKFARRKDREVLGIYDRFITRELYENLIVTVVSQFESFIFLYFPLSWLFEPFLATLCCKAHHMQWLIQDETTAYSGLTS